MPFRVETRDVLGWRVGRDHEVRERTAPQSAFVWGAATLCVRKSQSIHQ
jgi:hypothetical protein